MMESAEIVQALVVALLSFAVLGYLMARFKFPVRRFPTPRLDIPTGFGALECDVIEGTPGLTAPISREPCVGWQIEGRSVDAAFGPLSRGTGDWCDEILVRLRSGEVVVLQLPAGKVWVSSERRCKGDVDHEWSMKPETRGGGGLGGMEAFEESVVLPGDHVFIVGLFIPEDGTEHPMRRDGAVNRKASLAWPAGIRGEKYAAVVHAGPYAELGWRGRRARRWFFAVWPLWLAFYAVYVAIAHILPRVDAERRERREKASEHSGVESR